MPSVLETPLFAKAKSMKIWKECSKRFSIAGNELEKFQDGDLDLIVTQKNIKQRTKNSFIYQISQLEKLMSNPLLKAPFGPEIYFFPFFFFFFWNFWFFSTKKTVFF